MSVRKEDKKKTECPSRDYGMSAAAVIGVGIGAALCYYLNKRARNPDSTGATTSGWTCEGPVPSGEEDRSKERRVRAFNERSWSLEECSICFDVMLINQELMSLPCSHFFHTQCLLPWLHEQQTCPNCRKKA